MFSPLQQMCQCGTVHARCLLQQLLVLVVTPGCEYPYSCICIHWCLLSVQAQLDKLQNTPSEHSLSTVFPNKPLDKGKDERILGRLSPQLMETTGQQDVAKADHKSVSLVA